MLFIYNERKPYPYLVLLIHRVQHLPEVLVLFLLDIGLVLNLLDSVDQVLVFVDAEGQLLLQIFDLVVLLGELLVQVDDLVLHLDLLATSLRLL